ncbi:MAG: hypothetical protein QM493_01975 [Sulfurovum sp.]
MNKKEKFSEEEKQLILNKLNRKRKKQQKIEEPIKKKMFKKEIKKLQGVDKKEYTKEEKDAILDRLNRDRLKEEKREHSLTKKVYKINTKDYYKFIDMHRSYYIRVDALPKLSRKPKKLLLYYKILNEFKNREVIVISPSYSKNLFVAINVVKQNFIEYRLEDK